MPVKSIVILLVIIAVFLAGCTHPDEPVVPTPVPMTVTPISTSDSIVVLTAVPHTAVTTQVTQASIPVRIFSGEYDWAEYRINNTITLPPNPRYQWEYAARIERSPEDYNGIPAIHETITISGDDSKWRDGKLVTVKGAFHARETRYYERSTKRFLGGTSSRSGAGCDPYDETLPGDDTYREDRNWGWLLIAPFEDTNSYLYDEGSESVTVPAGTYRNARNYSGNFHNLSGFPITFWISEGVPVPVQYRIRNPELGGEDPIQTFELKAWG